MSWQNWRSVLGMALFLTTLAYLDTCTPVANHYPFTTAPWFSLEPLLFWPMLAIGSLAQATRWPLLAGLQQMYAFGLLSLVLDAALLVLVWSGAGRLLARVPAEARVFRLPRRALLVATLG